MPTSISGTSAYCTAAQLTSMYDHRSIGQLLTDEKVKLELPEILASTILDQLLKEASGMVEAACLVGKKYSSADLEALAGTNGGALLARLVADLAIGLLWRRRPHLDKAIPPQFTEALAMLQLLRDGARIFPLEDQAAAGLPSIDVQSAAEIEAENRASFQAARWLGVRSNRNRD